MDRRRDIPRLVPGVEIRKLPIGPIEGFVLSCVDGKASTADIADLTGLGADAALQALEVLVGHGAVEWKTTNQGAYSRAGRAETVHSGAIEAPRTKPTAMRSAPSTYAALQPTVPLRRDRDAEPTSPDPVRPSATSNPVVRPSATSNPVVRPSATSNPVVRPSATSNPVVRPSATSNPVVRPSATSNPVVRPSATSNPVVRPSATSNPVVRPSATSNPVVRPSATSNPVVVPAREPDRATEPAGTDDTRPTTRPSAVGLPAAEPRTPSTETRSPAKATDPAIAKPTDDAIEIPPDRRKRIDDLYVAIDLLDHYQVLGIERTADRARVKSAYFELSKIVHPDTAFRRSVGPYRQRMEVVFKRLTEAYETLSKKKPREEYDAYLARSEISSQIEAVLRPPGAKTTAPARPSVRPPAPEPAPPVSAPAPPIPEPLAHAPTSPAPEPRPAVAPHGAARPPSRTMPAVGATPPIEPTASRTPRSEDSKRRAQELIQRRLRPSMGTAAPTHPPTPPLPSASRDEVLRGLASSLKTAQSLSGVVHDTVERERLTALQEIERGEIESAVRRLRHIAILAPDRPAIGEALERASSLLAASLSETYAQQAVYEERSGKWAAAAMSWAKVIEGRPLDAGAHWRTARAILESKGDAREAARRAMRAVELAPNDPFAARTLGRAYLAAGMSLNAKRELERALQLDPSDVATKELLKELRSA